MANPGFPVGRGRRPRRGGVDSRGGYVLKILYVETKESGPFGGACPRSANGYFQNAISYKQLRNCLTTKRFKI